MCIVEHFVIHLLAFNRAFVVCDWLVQQRNPFLLFILALMVVSVWLSVFVPLLGGGSLVDVLARIECLQLAHKKLLIIVRVELAPSRVKHRQMVGLKKWCKVLNLTHRVLELRRLHERAIF